MHQVSGLPITLYLTHLSVNHFCACVCVCVCGVVVVVAAQLEIIDESM